MAPCFLILADSQDAELPPTLAGLVLPLFIFKPGLDHPPPGTGDGLRDRDIGSAGVPIRKGQETQRLASE